MATRRARCRSAAFPDDFDVFMAIIARNQAIAARRRRLLRDKLALAIIAMVMSASSSDDRRAHCNRISAASPLHGISSETEETNAAL